MSYHDEISKRKLKQRRGELQTQLVDTQINLNGANGNGLNGGGDNPIVEVNLYAEEQEGWVYSISGEPYVGYYHKHQDNTYMIGSGSMGDIHTINPSEVIHKPLTMTADKIEFTQLTAYDKQELRELVSDLIYKSFFQLRDEDPDSNIMALTDKEVLSLQTTIRDGFEQTGREEDETLVFYKKDRNTLESISDLESDFFLGVCDTIWNDLYSVAQSTDGITTQHLEDGGFRVYDEVPYREEEFDIEGSAETGPQKFAWVRRFRGHYGEFGANELGVNDFIIAVKIEFWSDGGIYNNTDAVHYINDDYWTNVLNLTNIVKPKSGTKVNPEKAREILDTNIFELLPYQNTRQDEINNFFDDFDSLIGNAPPFVDVNGDGVGEYVPTAQEALDEQSRISYENKSTAYITRLDSQANSNNQGKTLETMRNKLNRYLGDVDNVVQVISDQRPEYENKSNGFLKIRRPNQAIILRDAIGDKLEFQKLTTRNGQTGPSFLIDGFTITMWVRFVNKVSEGTLFNFGNPLSSTNPYGFRLDTKVNEYNGNFYRYLRLVVIENIGAYEDTPKLRDNHFGYTGPGPNLGRLQERSRNLGHLQGHNAFPQISTDDLDEWYFICATYNPFVDEDYSLDYATNIRPDLLTNKQFWLNHISIFANPGEYSISPVGRDVTDNRLLGAKCKVEVISRSELLRARGFRVGDEQLTMDVSTPYDTQIAETQTQETETFSG